MLKINKHLSIYNYGNTGVPSFLLEVTSGPKGESCAHIFEKEDDGTQTFFINVSKDSFLKLAEFVKKNKGTESMFKEAVNLLNEYIAVEIEYDKKGFPKAKKVTKKVVKKSSKKKAKGAK